MSGRIKKQEIVFGEDVCSAMLLHTRKHLTSVKYSRAKPGHIQ